MGEEADERHRSGCGGEGPPEAQHKGHCGGLARIFPDLGEERK